MSLSRPGHARSVQVLLAASLGAALALGIVYGRLPARADLGRSLEPTQRTDAAGSSVDAGSPPDNGVLSTDAVDPDVAQDDAAALVPVAAVAALAADPGLHIDAEPELLRVWANTAVRLRAVAPEGSALDHFTWHFEDGSDPVVGREVEHVFAESVRDRHVTLEARGADAKTVVVSRLLAVERLDVVPVDGGTEAPDDQVPAPDGARLLFAGGALDATAAGDVARAAARLHADVVVASGDAASAAALSEALGREAPAAALLHWPVEPSGPDATIEPVLRILRNPEERLTPVLRGDHDTGVLALGELALVAVDSRAANVGEPELRHLRDALQVAGAYSASLLLSARALTALVDGEVIADRAYRIYEYALRHRVQTVVSSASGVGFDGRFGGVGVVAVGAAQPATCARLAGSQSCQPGSLSLVDVSARGKATPRIVLGPEFRRAAPRRMLPAEVGKVRR